MTFLSKKNAIVMLFGKDNCSNGINKSTITNKTPQIKRETKTDYQFI
jgi:hypothetical protein